MKDRLIRDAIKAQYMEEISKLIDNKEMKKNFKGGQIWDLQNNNWKN